MKPERADSENASPAEEPAKVEADPMDFELPEQQDGAQRVIVCEGGCE
jgi:hypothetical protein